MDEFITAQMSDALAIRSLLGLKNRIFFREDVRIWGDGHDGWGSKEIQYKRERRKIKRDQ